MISNALMTSEQLADYLKVSPDWVRRHTYDLPIVRVGKVIRFPKSDIDRWLTARYCGAPPTLLR